ncbi:MAG: TRAP transporter large permease [Hyphomicrobiaceae bacterium]|nr:TRAP transporter large permease [Hyphomicrobiaceae bacterium]
MFDESNMTLIVFGALGLALLLGIPVGYSLGIAALAGLLLTPIPLVYMAQTLYTGAGLFPLIAIPGFILAGEIMMRTGLTDRIVRVVYLLVGNVPGGLAVVTILSCAFFASLSGSGPATTAAIGAVMIPTMVRAGYPAPFAAAVAATGGTLGILIPPSNPMIVYAVMTKDVSVRGLFAAGVLPGLLLTLILALTCLAIGMRRGYRATGEGLSLRKVAAAAWDAKLALLMPLVVLGSIYTGAATPTESSMLAVVYAMAAGALLRRLSFPDIMDSMIATGKLTGAVLIIMGPAMAFGKLLTLYQIPDQIATAFIGLSQDPVLVLVMISLLLVIVGMFMETLSTIVLLTPIFLPAVMKLGVDPVHFGILFVVLSEVGFLTPPLGVNLFVASALSNVPIEKVSRAALLWVGLLLAFTMLLILVPWLTTVGYQLAMR